MDKVSIIIVTYNAVADLQICLDSIRNQSYSALEVVVVDGESQDGTIEILKKNDDLITRWISEKDKGIYDAMNKALKLITGKWVYFLGADDTLLPGFSEALQVLKEKNTIYYGSVLKEKKKYLGFLNPYQQAKIGICHQAMIYPKEVFERYSFDVKYHISADHHLNMKCWADPDIKIEFADYIIANFNHTGVSSIQEDKVFKKQKSRLILKYFGILVWMRFVFREMKWKLLQRKQQSESTVYP
jgi:glycosyltransferase involved in cell wall biosynthesis